MELGEFVGNDRVYDLAPLQSNDQPFQVAPDLGIQSVAIKKFRMTVNGTKERITLEVSPGQKPNAIYHLREKLYKGIPASQLTVTQVGISVTFVPDIETGKLSTKSFEISWPNSMNMRENEANNKYDIKIDVVRNTV